ncbi:hypothetical protein [Terriglobus roseus]|uniref:hypothetical protein n=1 Tax=Terriglobus roseus TaxID=392734 RepID=UPI00147B5D32|nr:hypothetical protein [Terriglobus roseus]
MAGMNFFANLPPFAWSAGIVPEVDLSTGKDNNTQFLSAATSLAAHCAFGISNTSLAWEFRHLMERLSGALVRACRPENDPF